MKTQIIRLEVHDDTISVRDKMDWSQSPRVLLIWPDRGKVLRSRLDLVILERYCSAHGSQLALVTSDPEVIFQAGEVGIPVFSSRGTAQIQSWRKSFREFNRRELIEKAAAGRDLDLDPIDVKEIEPELPAWARITIFTIALLGVLAVLGMLLPAATIYVDLEPKTRNLEIPVQAVEGAVQTNLSGTIPIRKVQVTVSDRVDVPATGSVEVPSEIASGEVVFTNLGEDEVTIPQGTVLSTSGENPIQFLTIEDGTIQGGIGEELSIPVTALTPGEVGNLPAGVINTIGGSLGAILSANNPEPTSGGADIQIKAPSAADRRQTDRLLSASFIKLVGEELESILEPGDIQLTSNLNEYVVQNEEVDPIDGEPGAELSVARETIYTVPYSSHADLEKFAQDLVLAQYQDKTLEPLLDTLQVDNLSAPQKDADGYYSWEIKISWKDHKKLDHDRIIQIALGKNPEQANLEIQKEFKLEGTPRIHLTPNWWGRMPFLPFRIIIVEGEN